MFTSYQHLVAQRSLFPAREIYILYANAKAGQYSALNRHPRIQQCRVSACECIEQVFKKAEALTASDSPGTIV